MNNLVNLNTFNLKYYKIWEPFIKVLFDFALLQLRFILINGYSRPKYIYIYVIFY